LSSEEHVAVAEDDQELSGLKIVATMSVWVPDARASSGMAERLLQSAFAESRRREIDEV
jgi:hypothetical protein